MYHNKSKGNWGQRNHQNQQNEARFKTKNSDRYRGARGRYNNSYNNKQSFKKYDSRYQKYNDQSTTITRHRPNQSHANNSRYKKPKSRPVSPVEGSEEYTTRKIQQTSAIIMRHLLTPGDNIISTETSKKNQEKSPKKSPTPKKTAVSKKSNKNKIKNSTITKYKVEEIYDKIMTHITNLNHGKKRNLINSNESGYDNFIDHIQKQKRLEISRALRDMCSAKTQESSDLINSIIPDVGIKIEELPMDVINQLRNTLCLDFDDQFEDQNDELPMSNSEFFSLNEPCDHSIECAPANDTLLESSTSIKTDNTDYKQVDILDNHKINDKGTFSTHNTFIKQELIEDQNLTQEKSEKEIFEFNKIIVKQELFQEETVDDKESSVISFEENMTREKNTSENLDSINVIVKQELLEENDFLHNEPITKINEENLIHEEISTEESCGSDNLLGVNQKINSNLELELRINESLNDSNALPNDHLQQSNEIFRNSNDIEVQTDTKHLVSQRVNTNKLWMNFDLFYNQFTSKNHEQMSTTDILSKITHIDNYCETLTKYRQTLLKHIVQRHKLKSKTTPPSQKVKKKGVQESNTKKKTVNKDNTAKKTKNLKTNKNKEQDKRIIKKRKNEEELSMCDDAKRLKIEDEITIEESSLSDIIKLENENLQRNDNKEKNIDIKEEECFELPEFKEKVLVIKHIDEKIVAATESGKIYICYSNKGHAADMLQVDSVPITSLLFIRSNNSTTMYVGSLGQDLKLYNFNAKTLISSIETSDGIQCMEEKWGKIFIGCRNGLLLRYSIHKNKFEFEEKLSIGSILVIKATQEGSRRVLLVGSRNSPVVIRDAMSGLYMRNLDDVISPTVYGLLLENSLVYCGTTKHIIVFSFHGGKLISKLSSDNDRATSEASVCCLKLVKNLLFAGCHNGNIYVYNTKKNKFIGAIQGPGGVILSMEVVKNHVIIGTMAFHFKCIPFPENILRELIK